MENEKKKSAFAVLMDKMRGSKEDEKEPSPEMQKKNLEDLGLPEDEYKKFRKGLMGKG